MRALVTGATGFVGKHLVAHLHAFGDEVIGVDRECDITDLASVQAVVKSTQPDVVFHLAAFSSVGESWKYAELCHDVNVNGTSNVLAALRDYAPTAQTLVVSSSDVYGIVQESDLPIAESQPLRPVNPYAESKVAAEQVSLRAVEEFGQEVVVVRPFNHIGPGQSTQFVVPALASRLLEAARTHRREIIVGDLTARRDFCDVRDVVRAYRLLATGNFAGQVFNVASGQDISLGEVAQWLVDEIAPGCELVVDENLLRPVELPVMRGDSSKLLSAVGWRSEIDLWTSLRDVIADLRVATN